jgi:predicted acyl esterase
VNVSSRVMQRVLGLPPPSTRDLVVQRDLRVPMPDGAHLLADRWAPRVGATDCPPRSSGARTAGAD